MLDNDMNRLLRDMYRLFWDSVGFGVKGAPARTEVVEMINGDWPGVLALLLVLGFGRLGEQ